MRRGGASDRSQRNEDQASLHAVFLPHANHWSPSGYLRYALGVVSSKKRLPVLKSAPPEDPTELRPPWHWVGFGAAAILLAWVLLTYIAQALVQRWIAAKFGSDTSAADISARVAQLTGVDRWKLTGVVIGMPMLALVLGCIAGAYLVGRWGDRNASTRECALSGFAAALIVAVLTVASGPASWTIVGLVILATLSASVGGFFGIRKRNQAQGSP